MRSFLLRVAGRLRPGHSAPTLRAVLVRYLVVTVLLCCAAMLLWWHILSVFLDTGFVLRADAMESIARQARAQVEQAGAVDPAALPDRCAYVLFAAPGSDEILATNLTGARLDDALAEWHGTPAGRTFFPNFYLSARQRDGSVYLFQYDFRVLYGDPALQARLPDFQTAYTALLVAGLGLIIFLTTRRTGRRLVADARRLADAAARIAAHDLEGPPFGGATVREFADALSTTQTLREALAASLQSQWDADRRRAKEAAALAHDLRTPLAVIAGNAELLAEDDLTPAQREQVDAILRRTEDARAAVTRLRAVTAANSRKR